MHPKNPTRTIGPLLVVLLAIWICACDQSVDPGTQDSGVVDSTAIDTQTHTDGATPDVTGADGAGDQTVADAAAKNTVKVTYQGKSVDVDLGQPTPVTFAGAPHALLSDVVALGVSGKALDSLQADFTSSDGYNPGSKSNCASLVPVPGNLFQKGYIDVSTRRLRWDTALQYPSCLNVKDLAEITITDK